MKTLLKFASVAFLLASCSSSDHSGCPVCHWIHGGPAEIDPAEMNAIVAGHKTILVDARANSTCEDGERIPGAIGLGCDTEEAAILAALPDKNAAIVIYCNGPQCPKAGKLAHRLTYLDYKNVSVYKPGIKGWKAAGGQIAPKAP